MCRYGYRSGEALASGVVRSDRVRYAERMESFGRVLIVVGVVALGLGLLFVFAGSSLSFLGRLPGDLRIERPGFRLYVPITTSLLLSAVLSLVFWLVSRFR